MLFRQFFQIISHNTRLQQFQTSYVVDADVPQVNGNPAHHRFPGGRTQRSIENKVFQNQQNFLTFTIQNTDSKKQNKEGKHRDLRRQNFINL